MLPRLFTLKPQTAALILLLCPVAISLPERAIGDQSEIFEISTRHLPDQFRSIDFQNPNVEINKWQGNGWQCSTVEDALPAVEPPPLSPEAPLRLREQPPKDNAGIRLGGQQDAVAVP